MSKPKSRVFVSSVMDGFEAVRKSARQGIEAAELDPVMVEDFPALAGSSRTACLDGVESSDALVIVIGGRGGWTAPSGKLVVEEEWEAARTQKIPTFVFLQDVRRDAEADRLARSVSDYVTGNFRKMFKEPGDLMDLVSTALRAYFSGGNSTAMRDCEMEIEKEFAQGPEFQNETTLRAVLVPERDEEVFDPIGFDDDSFQKAIYAIAHDGDPSLMSYESAKTHAVGVDRFMVSQNVGQFNTSPGELVRLSIAADGLLRFDVSVTGAGRERTIPLSSMVIREGDVSRVVEMCLHFAANLFAKWDPYERHQRFYFNAQLRNTEHRSLLKDEDDTQSVSLRMHGEKDLKAFDRPRLLGRGDLVAPGKLAGDIVTMLRRRLQD